MHLSKSPQATKIVAPLRFWISPSDSAGWPPFAVPYYRHRARIPEKPLTSIKLLCDSLKSWLN